MFIVKQKFKTLMKTVPKSKINVKLIPKKSNNDDSIIFEGSCIRNNHIMRIEKNILIVSSNTQWLENLHIIGFFNILREQFPIISGLCDPAALMLSSDFVPTINDKAVFVINTDQKKGSHWIVISNIHCENETWRVYNSSCKISVRKATKILLKKIYPTKQSIELDICNVQQQIGSNDCGFFALAFVTTLCEGKTVFLIYCITFFLIRKPCNTCIIYIYHLLRWRPRNIKLSSGSNSCTL